MIDVLGTGEFSLKRSFPTRGTDRSRQVKGERERGSEGVKKKRIRNKEANRDEVLRAVWGGGFTDN